MDESIQEALRIAAALIDAGIPVFAAPPCPGAGRPGIAACTRPGHIGGAEEYDLPAKWQMTIPAKVWLERWQPGWALAAVGGHAADFLDEDPRNGGHASVDEMQAAGHWPTVFGVQDTPSGGSHYLISPLAERKVTGFLPGLDYQGGAPDGKGRGFVWIAPTVKRSKVSGERRPYAWTQAPDLEWLADFPNGDDSTDGVRLRLGAYRATRVSEPARVRLENGAPTREFTFEAMRHFCSGPEQRLRLAEIGQIEERANEFACTLSHFVPGMLTEEQAFDVLMDALGETAYDPMHPASGWEADKFRDVLTGERDRAPGDWYAVQVPATAAEAAAAVHIESDAVSALLAEMLTADDIASRKPPRYLIDGLLQFDSESWLIGEPGSKKSFVALDMAAHVATGRMWQGRRVNPALVVFVVAEGAGGSAARVRAWQQKYEPMGENIRFLPRPVQSADLTAWAVLVQACARLAGVAKERERGMLVVLDTQARVTVGLKENDATDMGVFIDAIGAIRNATGACVLTIHHTGRRGGDARGSSAIDGAQTTELKVVKVRDLYGKIFTEKQKDIVEAEPIKIKFESVDLGQDDDGRAVNSLVMLPHDAWNEGEVDDETLENADAEEAKRVTPFTARADVERWTHALTPGAARVQRWALQTLADVGGERGLTEAKWRELLATKVGTIRKGAKVRRVEADVWADVFKWAIDSTSQASAIVVQRSPDRWAVDPVALDGLRSKTD